MGILMGSDRATAARLGYVLATLVCVLAFSAGPASAAGKPLPRPVPVGHDALARALAKGQLTPATYALERARSLFRLAAVRREFGEVARPDPHAATLILRDLALRVDQLPPAERAKAERLLARPSDGADDPEGFGWVVDEAPASPICDANVCYHWVNFADDPFDGAPAADSDTNGVPDWVEDVVQPTFANVWQEEIVDLGNPAPLSDNTSPNDGGENEGDPNRHKLDVYLVNVGADGLFGFCSSDDPRQEPGSTYRYFDISAYCVIDNDFLDFGGEWSPQEFLQATAAHEFRHASQFAEDAWEDWWLLEGEAMWMEGVVYPDITDRIDYLVRSPIRRSARALDHGAGGYEYGAWIFFRFLGEYFDDVAVMREIWARADGSGDSDGIGPDEPGPDEYSMQATATAIAGRGAAFTPTFATFAEWNRSPSRYYDEGALYPSPFTAAEWRLGPGATTGWRSTRLRHLATAYYSFKPRSTVRPAAKLRVAVDGPALATKPAAKLIVVTTSGYLVHTLSLNSSGNAARTVSFAPGVVKRVDLVLTNASRRYRLSTCWTGRTTYSCGGAVAVDELRTYRFKATVG
jgi:hypothetical protein